MLSDKDNYPINHQVDEQDRAFMSSVLAIARTIPDRQCREIPSFAMLREPPLVAVPEYF